MRRLRALPLVLLTAVCAGRLYAKDHADLVLRNGTVYTMDARRPRAQAVAVRGSTIAVVGTDQEVAALIGPGTRVIDLGGRTAVPGFIESHGHLLDIGFARMRVDLVGTRTDRDVVDRVAAAVKTRKPGEWMLGSGWHGNCLAG